MLLDRRYDGSVSGDKAPCKERAANLKLTDELCCACMCVCVCVCRERVKNAQQRAVVYLHVHAHIQLYTKLNYMWLADDFLKQTFQRKRARDTETDLTLEPIKRPRITTMVLNNTVDRNAAITAH